MIFKSKIIKLLCIGTSILMLTSCSQPPDEETIIFASTNNTEAKEISEETFFDVSNLTNFEENYQGKTVKGFDKEGIERVGTFEKTKVTFSEEELSKLPVEFELEHIPRYGHSFFPLNNIDFIVVHNTANPNADAEDHYYYINNNKDAETSAHFYVDDTKIIQALPTNMECWSVGLNKNLKYQQILNSNSINIEICETGDKQKAIENAMYLIKYLLHPAFPEAMIVRHYDATLKDCPRYIEGSDWDNFLLNCYSGNIPTDYYEKLEKTKIE